ncbi:FixH family protein [Leptospira yanagawae]|nr:FixH family protein [Leptospira yanagawae]
MMFKDLHPSLRNAMYVVLFSFTALVAATFYTIRLTFQHFEPVMDKNYYEIGLNYEKAIENQKDLLSQGYQLTTNWDNTTLLPLGESNLTVSLNQKGVLAKADSIYIVLERNATTKHTARYDLTPSNLSFTGKISLKETGTWNLRIISSINGKTFEREGKITVR